MTTGDLVDDLDDDLPTICPTCDGEGDGCPACAGTGEHEPPEAETLDPFATPADRDQGNTNSQHLPVDAELVADHRDRGGCPWIITGDEGTSHCSLAERGSSDLDALVAMPEWQAWVAAEDAMGKACRREKRRG